MRAARRTALAHEDLKHGTQHLEVPFVLQMQIVAKIVDQEAPAKEIDELEADVERALLELEVSLVQNHRRCASTSLAPAALEVIHIASS